MIEINFLPLEFRKKKRADYLVGKFNLPLEVIIGLGGGLLMLVLLVHILLLFFNINSLAQYKRLQSETELLKPAKEKTDFVMNELRQLQGTLKALEEISGSHKVYWAQKMDILSEEIPRGVWLKKLTFNGEMLLIEGSALSEKKREMINVHTLVGNIKKNKVFLDHLKEVDLSSIQRRRINKTELVDFLITARYQ